MGFLSSTLYLLVWCTKGVTKCKGEHLYVSVSLFQRCLLLTVVWNKRQGLSRSLQFGLTTLRTVGEACGCSFYPMHSAKRNPAAWTVAYKETWLLLSSSISQTRDRSLKTKRSRISSHPESRPHWVTAGLRTAIRAHRTLNWAETCSPAQSSFRKACLLFAVVLVHPPAQLLLMSVPLCQFSSGLLKEMVMRELSSGQFSFSRRPFL